MIKTLHEKMLNTIHCNDSIIKCQRKIMVRLVKKNCGQIIKTYSEEQGKDYKNIEEQGKTDLESLGLTVRQRILTVF